MPARRPEAAKTEIAMTSLDTHAAGAPSSHPVQPVHATDIRDVAAAAGVSTATVSRALRGLPRVSQSTRQRIQAAAASLGYVPSSAAAELGRRRGVPATDVIDQASQTIHTPAPRRGTIVVINELLTGQCGQHEPPGPGSSEMEQLIQDAASANGFSACVTSCSPAEMLENVRSVPVSTVGIIIGTPGPSFVSAELPRALASAPIPTVQVHLSNNSDRMNEVRATPPPPACTVVICGAGIYGYKLAIDYLGAAVRSDGSRGIKPGICSPAAQMPS
jgi:3-dehydroquinate dehydratase II